jgi:hypothetical protein
MIIVYYDNRSASLRGLTATLYTTFSKICINEEYAAFLAYALIYALHASHVLLMIITPSHSTYRARNIMASSWSTKFRTYYAITDCTSWGNTGLSRTMTIETITLTLFLSTLDPSCRHLHFMEFPTRVFYHIFL